MGNIIKIKKEELSNQNLGNFLYEKDDELYFCDRLDSVMFVSKEDYKSNGENIVLSMDFRSYVQKIMHICSSMSKKPSLLFINCTPKQPVEILNMVDGKHTKNYTFVSELKNDEDFEIFNKETSITCVQTGVIPALKRLVETRSGSVPQNDVFVFFDEPEWYNNLNQHPGIDTILSVCRSRKIYFVFNFINSSKFIEKYGEDVYQTMSNYCPIKFICDNDKVVDIQF